MVAIFVVEKLCKKDDDALEALDQAFRLLSLSSVICWLIRLRRFPLCECHAHGWYPGSPHFPCEASCCASQKVVSLTLMVT